MPLSEEEQRLLEQMEQALATEDPKFASTLRGSTLQARSRRRAIGAAFGFLVGITVLMLGAIRPSTVIAVAGFLIMLGSAYAFVVLFGRSRGSGESRPSASKPVRKPKASSGSFMDKMEQRWRRRRGDS